MGGTGSGTSFRFNSKETLERLKRIKMNSLKGWMHDDPAICKIGKYSWKRDGEYDGEIGIDCYFDRIVLNYCIRERGGGRKPIHQLILLDSTACNYGGNRRWFKCSICLGRCYKLYFTEKLFLCRKCCNLPYQSQMKSGLQREVARLHSIGYRIFENYDGYLGRKKKGMHERTFAPLYSKYMALDESVERQAHAHC